MNVTRVLPLGLSGKLLLRFVVATVVLLIVVGLSVKHLFKTHFENNILPHMLQYFEYIRKDLGEPPNIDRAKILAKKLKLEIHIMTNDYRWSSVASKIDLNRIQLKNQALRFYKGIGYAHVHYKKRAYLLLRYSNSIIMYGIANFSENNGVTKHYPLFILILFLGILYYIIRRLFYPIKVIREGIRHFGKGDLSHRIVVNRKDELGQLAESINTMASDIHKMLDAKRELLLAISHELRTPLTRANVALEMSEDSKYKSQLKADLGSMDTLIDELLESERLSASHAALKLEPTDLSALIREVVAHYFNGNGIKLELSDESLILKLDQPRIKFLLKNLIDNALKYSTNTSAAPVVSLETNHKIATLKVIDSGAGISPEDLQHIFEPFYRVDPSRQRETGGVGLGLYLCRMLVDAHGGKIRINSGLNKGTEISVEFSIE